MTLATHPTPKLVAGEIGIVSMDPNAPWIWDLVSYVYSQFPYLDSKGVSGYVINSLTIPNGNNGTLTLTGIGGEFMILDTQDVGDMQAIWAPIIAHAKATWPDAVMLFSVNPYPTFQSWFALHYDTDLAGSDYYVGSHLLDAESLTANTTAVGEAFKTFQGSAYLVAGKGVQNAKPRGGSTSVTPSWRKALVHAGKLKTVDIELHHD
jgi:hypothetical protein